MKLWMTTALASAIFATAALADNASRGADNVTGPEVVKQGTEVDAAEGALERAATDDQASHGADQVTGAEAATNPLIDSDEVESSDATGVDTQSRGAGNVTGAEAVDETKSDG